MRHTKKWISHPALTVTVAALCYTAWIALVLFGESIPVWLLFVLGGYVVCLHGSLQHEAVHGHPFASAWVNSILVLPPLSLGYPYHIYRQEHLKHHRCETLTDAEDDPESLYFMKREWDNKYVLFQYIHRINFTLFGRVTIGPAVSIATLWRNQLRMMLKGDSIRIRIWLVHLALSAGILVFAYVAGGIPPWKYVLCFAYPGIALTLLRSYTEHRWSPQADERSIVIEGSPVSQLLYLNNNFHWLHHENPKQPWYELRGEFYKRRHEVLQVNGDFYLRSYAHLIPRLWRDRPVAPIHPS